MLGRRRQQHPTPVLLPGTIPRTEEPGGLQSMGSRRVRHGFTFTFHFHALEKELATHSSVLAWRIPGTVEPGGLPSMGLRRVGHDWSDLAAAAAGPCWQPIKLISHDPQFEKTLPYNLCDSHPIDLLISYLSALQLTFSTEFSLRKYCSIYHSSRPQTFNDSPLPSKDQMP